MRICKGSDINLSLHNGPGFGGPSATGTRLRDFFLGNRRHLRLPRVSGNFHALHGCRQRRFLPTGSRRILRRREGQIRIIYICINIHILRSGDFNRLHRLGNAL